MRNQDLALIVRDTTELPLHTCEKVVAAVAKALTSAASRRERIEIRGFGSFYPKARAARRLCHRNVYGRQGQPTEVIIPAGETVWFRPGKALLLLLNPGQYPRTTR